MRKTILGLAATAAIAIPLAATAANASVTIDTDGTGFVGKGDVQTVLGFNNAKMQAAVEAGNIKFTTTQAAEQALTTNLTQSGVQSGSQMYVQSAAQVGAQTVTQTSTETLSCFKTNGAAVQQTREGVKTGTRTAERQGTRDGVRFGTRDAERTGTRTGTKPGVYAGVLTSNVAYENKKTGQYTGFNLKGYVAGDPKFVGTGGITWGEPTFGDFAGFGAWTFDAPDFTTDFTFGAYSAFGPASFGPTVWTADWSTGGSNADPDVCLKADGSLGNNIQPGSVEHTFSDGPTVEGAVIDGAIYEGHAYPAGGVVAGVVTPGNIGVINTVEGAVTATGDATLFVRNGNGPLHALPNTPVL